MERARRRTRAGRTWAAVGLVGLALAAMLVPLFLPANGTAASASSASSATKAANDAEGGPRVLSFTLDDPITPVTAEDVGRGLRAAEAGRFNAYVVELDTPGGLDTSMREIVQAVLGSRVPVIVYVAPSGARAASAGAIVTYSAQVAAMAPGTTIGAATPVTGGGEDVGQKVVNDAAAYASSLAQLRGRNTELAGQSVLTGAAWPAEQAAADGLVDLVAASLDEVLVAVDGDLVTVAPADRTVRLVTAGASVERYDPGAWRAVLGWLADPALTYLLLTVGVLAMMIELASPGFGAGGVVAAVCLVLALFSLSLLPVSAVGLALLGLALALFVAEVLAPGVGVFAVGGAVCLGLSAVFLLPAAPGTSTSLALVLPAAVLLGAAAVVAGRLAARTRRAPTTASGVRRLVGRTVVAKRIHGDSGQAFCDGAWWEIRLAAGENDTGKREPGEHEGGELVGTVSYVVTAVDGLTLVVRPGTSGPTGPTGPTGPARRPPADDDQKGQP